MRTEKFSKSEAVAFGWTTMKNHFGFFAGLLVVVGLIYIIPIIISDMIKEAAPDFSLLINLSFWFLQTLVGMGLIRIALRFCDNEQGTLGDLFSCAPLFLKYLFGFILYALIVFGGMLLLIIPGIIWAIQFQFFSYCIIDKGLGPIEALKKSSAITKGAKSDLFLFGMLLAGLNLLGALALLVGLFATIPTTIVALASVYRKLLAQTEGAATP